MINRGQVWVETVVYTLVGLTLIGLVLAFVTPKINDYRDKAIIDQTIESLNQFDSKLQEVIQTGPGNVRKIEFQLKRGSLMIDPGRELVQFSMRDSSSLYSEPNESVRIGRITVLTKEGASKHTVELTLNYTGRANLTVSSRSEPVQFSSAPSPYQFSLLFNGTDSNNKPSIVLRELTGR